MKGFASRFQFSMYDLIVVMSARRDLNVPRLIDCRVIMPNHVSTWFNVAIHLGVSACPTDL